MNEVLIDCFSTYCRKRNRGIPSHGATKQRRNTGIKENKYNIFERPTEA